LLDGSPGHVDLEVQNTAASLIAIDIISEQIREPFDRIRKKVNTVVQLGGNRKRARNHPAGKRIDVVGAIRYRSEAVIPAWQFVSESRVLRARI
jgi:hypothetical protein